MDGHGGDGGCDLEFDDFIGQQADRPTSSSVWCRGTSQGGYAGLEFAIKSDLARSGLGFTLQCGVQSLFHKPFLEVLYGAGCYTECLGHISDFPWFTGATRTGVAQEKCAGMDEFRGIGFSAARDSLQHLALFLRQCDPVSRSHAL